MEIYILLMYVAVMKDVTLLRDCHNFSVHFNLSQGGDSGSFYYTAKTLAAIELVGKCRSERSLASALSSGGCGERGRARAF